MTPPADRGPATVVLPDGRTLAWYEFGDPAGLPCLSTTGTPASGSLGVLYDAAAREAGVRWISVDKPGYGHSSIDPQRSLARYVQDVRALLDHLAIDRVAVLGESGGGPHALALAHGLPERVTVAVIVSGLGPPPDARARKAMTPANRVMLFLARTAPWVLRPALGAMGRLVFAPGRERAFAQMMRLQQPEPDVALMRRRPDVVDALFAASVGGFRQGPTGAAQEFVMFARPWHFELEEITVPVELWHGTADINVPIELAHEMARRLPRCRAHIMDGGGHLVGIEHHREILASIVRHAA